MSGGVKKKCHSEEGQEEEEDLGTVFTSGLNNRKECVERVTYERKRRKRKRVTRNT